MTWLVLALLLAPPDIPAVEVQRPGEPVLWALEWDAPVDCPTRTELVTRIRSYLPALDEPPLQVPRARLRIEASIESDANAWTVRMHMSGEHGSIRRGFSAASCDELADAVALVAAVSLDPVVVTREVARARASASPVAPNDAQPEPEPEPDPPTQHEASPRADEAELAATPELDALARKLRMGLRVFGGGGFGPTTTPYGALAAGVALLGPRWRWSLDAGGWLPRTIRSDQAAGRFWGWWIGTRGCFVPSRNVVEFPVCGGVELGQARAIGLAPARNVRGARYPWVAGSVSGGVTWVITERVGVGVDVAALVPFLSGEFRVGDQTLQRIVPIGVRATLGLELRF